MNWNAVVGIVMALELVHGVLTYFLLSPIRELRKQVATLTNARHEEKIKDLRDDVDRIDGELVGKEALRAIDRKRSKQFGGMNGKIEILLQRTARFANHGQEAQYMAAIRDAEESEDESEI